VKQIRVVVAAVAVVRAGRGEAHVDDFDDWHGGVGRLAHARDVVQAADQPRPESIAAAVQDLDCPKPRALRDPLDSSSVVARSGNPGDVRAVPEIRRILPAVWVATLGV
jgi:hypothetical protein